ncbi:MAG: hypothetical protein ABSA70_08745 [Terriglobia bacterium]
MAGAPELVFSAVEIGIQGARPLVVREDSSRDLGPLVEMYAAFQPERVAQGLPPPDVPRITR